MVVQLEAKCKADGAWYDCEVFTIPKKRSKLRVHFIEFSEDEDEVYESVEEALSLLRSRSKAMDEGDCALVAVGQVLLTNHTTRSENKYFDAKVLKVKREPHTKGRAGRKACRCVFEMEWLESERKGKKTKLDFTSLCLLTENDPRENPAFAKYLAANEGKEDEENQAVDTANDIVQSILTGNANDGAGELFNVFLSSDSFYCCTCKQAGSGILEVAAGTAGQRSANSDDQHCLQCFVGTRKSFLSLKAFCFCYLSLDDIRTAADTLASLENLSQPAPSTPLESFQATPLPESTIKASPAAKTPAEMTVDGSEGQLPLADGSILGSSDMVAQAVTAAMDLPDGSVVTVSVSTTTTTTVVDRDAATPLEEGGTADVAVMSSVEGETVTMETVSDVAVISSVEAETVTVETVSGEDALKDAAAAVSIEAAPITETVKETNLAPAPELPSTTTLPKSISDVYFDASPVLADNPASQEKGTTATPPTGTPGAPPASSSDPSSAPSPADATVTTIDVPTIAEADAISPSHATGLASVANIVAGALIEKMSPMEEDKAQLVTVGTASEDAPSTSHEQQQPRSALGKRKERIEPPLPVSLLSHGEAANGSRNGSGSIGIVPTDSPIAADRSPLGKRLKMELAEKTTGPEV
eukprot:TRINITY_DN8597_c0_g1_i1.p1 TRINITY_DN8597_c0_g1~~TRINITY_DN8597_c0_g1_i1.p1  ORF type:complete len:664 (+),score=110.92 TRINITY_DN8597_c0_g1_i1:64-1992(+)